MERFLKRHGVLLALLALAAVLRLAGLGYGLPAVFNGDEPHLVNTAVSFGGGSLRPHVFKYPTLWMYLLFAAYGAWFALWSGFGILHSARQFAEMFVWDPSGFYLLGRLLAAAASVAAAERAFRTARLWWGDRPGAWAAAFLAVAPAAVVAAHAAKPESLMLLLSAWAWWFAARYLKSGAERDLTYCGLCVGLAGSSQYTAFPLAALIPAAWAARRLQVGAARRRWPLREPFLASAAAAGGFLIGTPYALLDWPAFSSSFRDFNAMTSLLGGVEGTWRAVLRNILDFSGSLDPLGLIGPGAALLWGAVVLCRTDRAKAVLLLSPVLVHALCLSFSVEGAWQRYLFAQFPALALIAAAGAEAALDAAAGRWPAFRRPAAHRALLVAWMIPGVRAGAAFDRELRLPDTRTEAAAWVEAVVPEGTGILLDQEHASPRLKMSLPMVERLLEQTEAAGHPKRKVYELMRGSHPGGGYALWHVHRGAADLRSYPGHVAFSEQGRAVLDVREGLEVARRAGIRIVVLTSYGADPARSPELARFFSETQRQGKLLAEFAPAKGRSAGPRLRVYDVSRGVRGGGASSSRPGRSPREGSRRPAGPTVRPR